MCFCFRNFNQEKNMRQEIINWIEQAEEEFETAKASFKSKKWFAVAFWCQQSSENMLKALYLIKKKKPTRPTHSLTYLGRELKIPNKFWTMLRELTKEYYMSRYPDAMNDIPYKTYNKDDAKNYLNISEKIIKWTKSQIKK